MFPSDTPQDDSGVIDEFASLVLDSILSPEDWIQLTSSAFSSTNSVGIFDFADVLVFISSLMHSKEF